MKDSVADAPLPMRWANAELLVLVLTMDLAPFDRVYREGALPTWLGDPAEGVAVVEYRGRPVPRHRLAWSGVRERIRLRSGAPVDAHFGSPSHPAIWCLNRATSFAFGAPTTPIRKAAQVLLRGLQGALMVCEDVMTRVTRHRLANCVHRDGVLHTDCVQTIGKMLDVQLPVFHRLLEETQAQGFLVATVSTYVDTARARDWQRASNNIDFASMPATFHKGKLFQGGCMYFSRRGLRQLVDHRAELRGGLINDIAITDWLTRTGREWQDLPVLSLTGFAGVPEQCPLCSDTSLIAVRCTQHADRATEIARMHAMHHPHALA